MDANFSEATESEAKGLINCVRQVRIPVLVAFGISVGLVAGFSLNSLRSNPQPPVDLLNIENKDLDLEQSPSDGGRGIHWNDFNEVCDMAWDKKPGWYSFYPYKMPSSHDWSYHRESYCGESTIRACENDDNCAGLAGHSTWKGKPQCWRIKVGARSVTAKHDWWVCFKKKYHLAYRR